MNKINSDDMISCKERLPEIGQKTLCKVNFWRFGQVQRTEILTAEYVGFNSIINKPMWDIETYDLAYAEVIEWKPLKENE